MTHTGSPVFAARLYGGGDLALYVDETAWFARQRARLLEEKDRRQEGDVGSRNNDEIAEFARSLAAQAANAEAERLARSVVAADILDAATCSHRHRHGGEANRQVTAQHDLARAAATVLRAVAAYEGRERPPARALCGTAVTGKGGVTITRRPGKTTPLVAGIARCNSPWTCAECAARRRQLEGDELVPAVQRHVHGGGGLLMMTPTARHAVGDDPGHYIASYKAALRTWRGRMRRTLVEHGYIGQVAAWHHRHTRHAAHDFHQHILLAFAAPLHPDTETLLAIEGKAAWVAACTAHGLTADLDVGLDLQAVRDPAAAARYLIANSGLDEALAGRPDLTTAWGLLDVARRALDEGWWHIDHATEALDTWAAYAKATEGLAWVQWSPGLRNRLAPPHEPDAMAEPPPETEEDSITVTPDEWTMIRSRRAVPSLYWEIQRYGAARALALVEELVRDCGERWPRPGGG